MEERIAKVKIKNIKQVEVFVYRKLELSNISLDKTLDKLSESSKSLEGNLENLVYQMENRSNDIQNSQTSILSNGLTKNTPPPPKKIRPHVSKKPLQSWTRPRDL